MAVQGRKDVARAAGDMKSLAAGIEGAATDVVAKVAPLVSPLPTAYLTARAAVTHLGWPTSMGTIAGVIVESLGLATTATALSLREYNQTKRKNDPPAPFGLAAALVGVYFASVTVLTVVLDTVPEMAAFAPLVFPVLSLAGMTVLALRADHRRRLTGIEAERVERREQRQASRNQSEPAHEPVQRDAHKQDPGAQSGVQNDVLDAVNRSRRERRAEILDAMVDIYVDDPEAGATDIARRLGIGRSSVYNYLSDLKAAGRIGHDNGTIRVLER